jgi:hypothetical protein
MFAKTRAMCVVAGSALLAALTGAAGSPAQAAPGNSLNIPWVALNTDTGLSVLPQQIKAGDCHLQGLSETGNASSARIELRPESYNPPTYWIQWDYSMYTDQSYIPFPDVWHATFVFKNASGAELFRWTADGPNMWYIQNVYTGEVKTQIQVNTNQVASISMVDWYGDC